MCPENSDDGRIYNMSILRVKFCTYNHGLKVVYVSVSAFDAHNHYGIHQPRTKPLDGLRTFVGWSEDIRQAETQFAWLPRPPRPTTFIWDHDLAIIIVVGGLLLQD